MPAISSEEEEIFHPHESPAGILVQRGPLKARLYLFSLNLRISEVIIQKNAETGRDNSVLYGGNGGGHI